MSNISLPDINNSSIAIIGLGYVGLPLAVEFANTKTSSSQPKPRRVIGFDINQKRIKELKNKIDVTNEISTKILEKN